MIDRPAALPPPDVCVLLRTHAEQHWLTREVVPLLRELQHGDPLPEEELGAPLAYLEALWIEACRRALETDAAFAELAPASTPRDRAHAPQDSLQDQARRYHGAVRALRLGLADQVARLIATADLDFTGEPIADVLSREAARHEADCIRSGRWRPGLTYSRIRRTPTAS